MNAIPIATNWLYLTVGFLGLVAIGVIIQVILSSQKEKLSLKSMFHGLLSLIWVLPLIGVLAYFGLKVAPSFEPHQPPNLDDSMVAFHTNETKTENDSTPLRYGDSVQEWVKTDLKKIDKDSYLVVVSSRGEDKLKSATEDAFNKAVKRIEAYYALENNSFGSIGITKEEVEKVRKKEFIETIPQGKPGAEYNMHRVHWQIALTPELRESLVSRVQQNVSKSRIWTLSSILAVCTLLLFGFSSYLRLDTQTEGRYRNRLKFSAVSFMAVGCLAIAEFFRLG